MQLQLTHEDKLAIIEEANIILEEGAKLRALGKVGKAFKNNGFKAALKSANNNLSPSKLKATQNYMNTKKTAATLKNGAPNAERTRTVNNLNKIAKSDYKNTPTNTVSGDAKVMAKKAAPYAKKAGIAGAAIGAVTMAPGLVIPAAVGYGLGKANRKNIQNVTNAATAGYKTARKVYNNRRNNQEEENENNG